MYIGPWQEFKLAKILQLKDKMEKEDQEDRGSTNHSLSYQHPPKAYSVNNRMGAIDDGSVSNYSGYSHPVYGMGQNQAMYNQNQTTYSNYTQQPASGESDSLLRARANQINTIQTQGHDNVHRYKVDQHLQPKKQVPILLPNGRTVTLDERGNIVGSRPSKKG